MPVRMVTAWLQVGQPTETSGWCDEHALPHLVTFSIHALTEWGVWPDFATYTGCLPDCDDEEF